MSAARHLSTALLATVGLLLAAVVVAPAAAAGQTCATTPDDATAPTFTVTVCVTVPDGPLAGDVPVSVQVVRHGSHRPRAARGDEGVVLVERDVPAHRLRPGVRLDLAHHADGRRGRHAQSPRPDRRRARLRGAGAGHGGQRAQRAGSSRGRAVRRPHRDSARAGSPVPDGGSGRRRRRLAPRGAGGRTDRVLVAEPAGLPGRRLPARLAVRVRQLVLPPRRATGSSGPSPTLWSGTTSTRHPAPRGTSSTGAACRTTTATTWPAGTSSPWTPTRGSASCGRAPRSTSGWPPTSVRTGRAARWCTCTTRATPSPPTKVAPSSDASGRCSPPAG